MTSFTSLIRPYPDETAPLGSARNWAHAPSPFAWSVMCYGGQHPRTGLEQPQLEVCFHKRTRPGGTGYTAKSIIRRANAYAKGEHRSHFAVRDVTGSVIYDGPVMNENQASAATARLSDADLLNLAKGHKGFLRNGGGK